MYIIIRGVKRTKIQTFWNIYIYIIWHKTSPTNCNKINSVCARSNICNGKCFMLMWSFIFLLKKLFNFQSTVAFLVKILVVPSDSSRTNPCLSVPLTPCHPVNPQCRLISGCRVTNPPFHQLLQLVSTLKCTNHHPVLNISHQNSQYKVQLW